MLLAGWWPFWPAVSRSSWQGLNAEAPSPDPGAHDPNNPINQSDLPGTIIFRYDNDARRCLRAAQADRRVQGSVQQESSSARRAGPFPREQRCERALRRPPAGTLKRKRCHPRLQQSLREARARWPADERAPPGRYGAARGCSTRSSRVPSRPSRTRASHPRRVKTTQRSDQGMRGLRRRASTARRLSPRAAVFASPSLLLV